MFKWLIRGGALVAVSVMLGSCESMVLPDFNGGMLNPDIRFLKAGEVMNGVKCAMTEFMREREEEAYQCSGFRSFCTATTTMKQRRSFYFFMAPSIGSELQTGQARILLAIDKTRGGDGSNNELNPYGLHLDTLRSHLDEIGWLT